MLLYCYFLTLTVLFSDTMSLIWDTSLYVTWYKYCSDFHSIIFSFFQNIPLHHQYFLVYINWTNEMPMWVVEEETKKFNRNVGRQFQGIYWRLSLLFTEKTSISNIEIFLNNV